jgi:hypothetical protein
VEALALRATLELLHAKKWLHVEVEPDCSILLTALDKSGDDLSDVGRIIEEYRVTQRYVRV